jgi:hypothetical protein
MEHKVANQNLHLKQTVVLNYEDNSNNVSNISVTKKVQFNSLQLTRKYPVICFPWNAKMFPKKNIKYSLNKINFIAVIWLTVWARLSAS